MACCLILILYSSPLKFYVMGQEKPKMRKEDLTGKAEQSEAAEQSAATEQSDAAEASIEQTERERHNKGAKDVTPGANTERDELKEAPESLKNSR
jgi:hypothetical protein